MLAVSLQFYAYSIWPITEFSLGGSGRPHIVRTAQSRWQESGDIVLEALRRSTQKVSLGSVNVELRG
jgi:hypothetical protein